GILSDIQRSKINYDKMYLMAKANDLSKDELTRLFKENDDINNRVNNEPVMAIVEYLIQDSIRRMNDNANKTSDDVRTEIMEAGSIGRDHAAAIAEKSLWIKEDLQKRFED
nr:hypothetical protein [Lachnospiraceae bacterium]